VQDRSRLKLDAQPGGAQARLDRERLRLVRALAFAEELAAALKREFAGAWSDGRGAQLRAAVEAVDAEAARGRGFLAAQDLASAIDALAALQAYDLAPLLATTKGLQSRADGLRRDLSGPAVGPPARTTGPVAPVRPGQVPRVRDTAPLAPVRGSGPLPSVRALPGPDQWGGGAYGGGQRGTGVGPLGGGQRRPGAGPGGGDPFTPDARSQGTAARPQAGPQPSSLAPLGPRRPLPPAPSPPRPAGGSARQQFDAAYQLAREILGYVAGRLALVQVSLAATGLPGPRAPWHHVGAALDPGADRAGIDAPMRPWLPLLAQLFYTDPAAAREALTALEQWRQSKDLASEAEALRARLAALPPEVQAQLLAQFEAGRLRASIHPLGHLHIRFKSFPHLSTIFPGPPPGRT